MKKYLPSVSIIIPTYNAEGTLALCLKSIQEQDYPKDRLETIIIDASSEDDTLKIAEDFKVNKILKNPLKTAEAGKSIGVEAAENEIIALIDSDNILEGRDWLLRMVEPFEDPEIVAAEPLYYTYRKGDPLVVRYSALIGANDPICMYLGNYDRYNYVTNKWTELPLSSQDEGDYLKITLNEENVPTIGANGFLVRKNLLKKTSYQPYLFDIDVVCELVEKGRNKFAKVKIGIIHLFAKDTWTFIKKQRRRIQDYLYFKKEKMRRYPWGRIHSKKIRRFVILTLLIFPLLFDALRGYRRIKDRAWSFHIPACWLTLLIYGSARIKDRWFKKKLKIREEDPGKKRVLILSPFFRPNMGGVETHLDDVCEYLRKHGFKIYIVTYQPLTIKAKGLRVEKKENLEIRRFPWFGYNWFPRLEKIPFAVFLYLTPGLLFYSTLFLLKNRKKIDVIHAHGLNAAFVGLIGSKIFHKRFVVNIHTIYRLKQRPLLAFLVRGILRHADTVLAVGEIGREDLVDIGLESKKVKNYIYSVNHELFTPLDKKVCRERLGLPLDRFIALFVGRFVAQKGIKVLVESIRYAHPDILFIFVGEGPDEKYIKDISIDFKNVLLCSSVPNDELIYYYSAADCFSWGSVDGDIIGKVCIEALLCGLPIIAPNRVELFGVTKKVSPSALPEGVGFLIEPDAKVLAAKLNFLLENRHILEEMKANCRKFAEENYGLKNIDLIIKSYLRED